MAQWKKVLVSGSAAELSSLSLDTALTVENGGTGVSTLSSGQVLLGAGTGNVTSVARGNLTGDGTKISVTGGTSAILGSGASLSVGGTIASGSDLLKIASLSSADSNIIVGSAAGWVAESGATARTSLGLGTGDSPTFAGATINGDVTGIGTASADYFSGDGSNLTGLPSAAINTYTGGTNNNILTAVDSNSVQGESNLTFNGSLLDVTGGITLSGTLTANGTVNLGDASGDTVTINAQTINPANIAAGTDNTVVVYNGSSLVTDEIDSRVWGTSLIDGAGSSARVSYFSDANTLTSAAGFTFDGTDLTVGTSTFGTDVVVAGDLTVNGDTFNVNVTNLAVEDRFMLLNSGSATGDGGFIVQTEAGFTGAAFGWDDSATRWSVQNNTKLAAGATTIAPDAYVSMVIDVDAGLTDISAHRSNGNIKVDSGEVYIYA
tara:strand:- start:1119 stop:2423 length:1305 start_codon:yes stop_codon:yes gene_type:complete